MKSMEIQSGHSELSVISQVSVVEGFPLSGVPLYMYIRKHRGYQPPEPPWFLPLHCTSPEVLLTYPAQSREAFVNAKHFAPCQITKLLPKATGEVLTPLNFCLLRPPTYVHEQ